jgi:hypothetical protein
LRLMGPIIAVLLAITLAIFPISMRQAAALGSHEHHVGTSEILHQDAAAAGDHDHSASCDTCGGHEPGSEHGKSSACCGMTVCHAFEVSTAPLISPRYSASRAAWTRDEQVGDSLSGRIDRPPRPN